VRFGAIVFDVLGTVVDEDAALRRATAELLDSADVDSAVVDAFAQQWAAQETQQMDAVRHAKRSWASHDELRAEALRSVVTNYPDGSFSVGALEEAALFGRQVEPWADFVAALEAMRGDHPVFALTNGSAATMAEMSERTGLEWTQLISADEVRAFKPSPEMYERVRVRGGLEPGRTLFVAAHPWDLDAGSRRRQPPRIPDGARASPGCAPLRGPVRLRSSRPNRDRRNSRPPRNLNDSTVFAHTGTENEVPLRGKAGAA
jgi:2-haloacid dehalogenase